MFIIQAQENFGMVRFKTSDVVKMFFFIDSLCSVSNVRNLRTFHAKHINNFIRSKQNIPNKPNTPTVFYVANRTTFIPSFLLCLLDKGTIDYNMSKT